MATKLIRGQRRAPRDAWRESCEKKFGEKREATRKPCPHGAYLGLCEDGEINGVNKGDYMRSRLGRKKNKEYAVEAVKLLRSYPHLASDKKQLWEKVREKTCAETTLRHNSQLDVVLALWSEGFINRTQLYA